MIEITVSQDGTADFTSIQEAMDQIPNLRAGSSERCTIYIRAGTYQEKIHLSHPGIHLVGEDAEETIITYGDYARKLFSDGSPYHTFNTYTLLISSDDVTVSHLTIENSAGNGESIGQAIAAYVDGDRVSFTIVDCLDIRTLYLRGRFRNSRSIEAALEVRVTFSLDALCVNIMSPVISKEMLILFLVRRRRYL